jgi:hypothetical protein
VAEIVEDLGRSHVSIALMLEIVKITWGAIAISEWQSINYAGRFKHGIVNVMHGTQFTC